MKEVVLDTETTGISVRDGHRLVEIGCIELQDLIPTKNRFHCYLNPERKVSEKALEVHGYTDEFLATQKTFLEVVDQFLEFIEDKRLIIHNAEFDLSHLNNELAILGKKKINNEIVDTLVLARDKFPGSPVSLDALCKRYRVDNSRRTQHTALIDCDLLAKVYINLIDQKEPTLNFQSDEKKTKLKNDIIDTLLLARDKFPGSQINLDALCKKFSIDNTKRTKHTALIDCDLLAKVYINLIDQKEPQLDFTNFNDTNLDKKEVISKSYFKKIILPSDEEILKHKNYLKSYLKKNYFN